MPVNLRSQSALYVGAGFLQALAQRADVEIAINSPELGDVVNMKIE